MRWNLELAGPSVLVRNGWTSRSLEIGDRVTVVERWTRKNFGTLENKVTIEDPGAYAKPFTVTFTAKLSEPGDELMENICQENNQFGPAGGYTNPYAKP